MSELKYLQLNPVHNGFVECPMIYQDTPYIDPFFHEIKWYRKLVPVKLYMNKILVQYGEKKESYMGILK
jgi:hypothetical protein